MVEKIKKIIVIGKGFLGTRIADEFKCEVFDREAVDLLYQDQINRFLDEKKPDVVINATGITGRPNIDWCEDNEEETIKGNVVAPLNLAIACKERNIRLVHFSSGCIYKGNRRWTEKDKPNFKGSLYSKTKICSEFLLETVNNFGALILRIRMPIDNKPSERNFIDKVVKYDKVINVKNSMTVVPDMIDALKKMIDKDLTGIYNVVNRGAISPAEIMFKYKYLVDPEHSFETINDVQLDELTKAGRSNCTLSTSKLEKEGIYMPWIGKSVDDCLLIYKELKK